MNVSEVKTAYADWQRSKEHERQRGWLFADSVLAYTDEHGRGSAKALADALGVGKRYIEDVRRAAQNAALDSGFRKVSVTTARAAIRLDISPEELEEGAPLRSIYTPEPGPTPEAVIEAIKANPELVKDAMTDNPTTSLKVLDIVDEMNETAKAERLKGRKPIAGFGLATKLVMLIGNARGTIREMGTIVDEADLNTLEPELREAYAGGIESMAGALGLIASALRSTGDLDSAFAELLATMEEES